MAIKPNNPMAPQPMNPSLNRPVTGGPRGPLRTGDSGSSSTNSGAGGGSSTTTPDVVSSTTAGTNPATFLYDVGLQNIYQDYQKSVATLNQQEQESLQDAYYIREMSKKYLGEYASNTGIGDVSGNLLDIYGAYQQNVAGIRSEFNTEERSLQQTYESTRRELETGKLLTEQQAAGNAPLGFTDLTSAQVFDMSGNLVENPNYIPGLDYSYFGVEGFDSTKQGIYINDAGVEYISTTKTSDQEADDETFPNSPTFAELTAFYKEQPNTKGMIPVEGNIVTFDNGANYVLRSGAWYRLEQTTTGVFSTIQGWRGKESSWNTSVVGGRDTTSKDVIISDEDAIKNKVYFNTGEGKYTNLNKSGQAPDALFDSNTTNNEYKAIVAEFVRVHGLTLPSRASATQQAGYSGQTGSPTLSPVNMKDSVIEYNGKLYFMNTKGQVWLLRKR